MKYELDDDEREPREHGQHGSGLVVLTVLPLTAGQILLNNFLPDILPIGIADDAVDPELVERPQRWNMRFTGRYVVEFGVLSSVFDFLTFGALLWTFHATAELFRTSWLVESLLTELVVALVLRDGHSSGWPGRCCRSRRWSDPDAFAIPYGPFADVFGFVPLPGTLVTTIGFIIVLDVAATELQKKWSYRSVPQ